MTNDDRVAFVGVIELLHDSYPEATFGWRGRLNSVVDTWFAALSDLPLIAIQRAAGEWVKTQRKMPHISELRFMLAESVSAIPSEGDVWKTRFRYWNQTPRDGDDFAFSVFAAIGGPESIRRMGEDDLRTQVGFRYRELVITERAKRTSEVGAVWYSLTDTKTPGVIG